MKAAALQSRRQFVHCFALVGAGWCLRGQRFTAAVLTKLQTQPSTEGGLLKLQVSDFPPLQEDFGSVRIGTSAIGSNHYPTGLFYPVLINRGPNGQFYALDSACTHEGCTVPTFDAALQYSQCLCHGSQYRIDGTVRRGPANFPLRPFTTRFDGSNALTIELPDISFSLEVVQVIAPASGRIQLQFIAFEQIDYEIRFRPDLHADWTGPVPFSLTQEGPIDQTSLTGAANIAQVFLEKRQATGFYTVIMRTRSV